MTKSQMIETIFQDLRQYKHDLDMSNPKVREYAELFTEDMNRKGCIPETYPGPECRECGSCVDGKCPLEDWKDRHPEFENDELEQKLRALETELFGWHIPSKDRTIWLNRGTTTVAELIAELQKYPEGTTINMSSVIVKLP